MAQPINILLAVVLSTISTHIVGFVWYSVLFSNIWLKAAKIKVTDFPKDFNMTHSLMLELLSRFIRALVFIFFYINLGIFDFIFSYQLAFYFLMGFTVPHVLSRCAWEFKTVEYFLISVSEALVSFLVIATIANVIL